MALTLHLHPLSSYCHKVLIALYENGTPFDAEGVNLMDAAARADYLKLSPFGKIPALTDSARGVTIGETSIVIEYLQQQYPGAATLLPTDPQAARDVRYWDRVMDVYLHTPMQKIVGDVLRPENARDPHGVGEARATIATALALMDARLGASPYLAGDTFTMADCAAAPPLFYLQAIVPYAQTCANVGRYFETLAQRPSYARVLREAKPFLQYFPFADKLPTRFTA